MAGLVTNGRLVVEITGRGRLESGMGVHCADVFDGTKSPVHDCDLDEYTPD
jgi:hypothetical protein